MALLSPRERQVLEAIAVGRPNKLIAYDLGISVRTVEVHRAHMLDRLGARNIAEAIRIVVIASVTALAS
jgi:two-component system, LuxR family, response regulator FixJ